MIRAAHRSSVADLSGFCVSLWPYDEGGSRAVADVQTPLEAGAQVAREHVEGLLSSTTIESLPLLKNSPRGHRSRIQKSV